MKPKTPRTDDLRRWYKLHAGEGPEHAVELASKMEIELGYAQKVIKELKSRIIKRKA